MFNLSPKNIAVFGDLILDKYTFGNINRISPEAPVPVIEIKKSELKLGGAGNVLLNLIDLGMKCTIFGRVGADENGEYIKSHLNKLSISCDSLFTNQSLPTITKTRIIAANQQVLRMDEEKIEALDHDHEKNIINKFKLKRDNYDAIILSDYGKGYLTHDLCQGIISLANEKNIPVIIDPKGADFSKYNNATVITPNLKEAQLTDATTKDIKVLGENIIEKNSLDFLLITRSQDGISYFKREESKTLQIDFPVLAQEVTDVTGAGDTVIAVTTACLANEIDHNVLCELCNVAGAYVVGHFGATTISNETLISLYNNKVE
jgi:rfaE bifunctional protein kinase chain/domain